jgi:autonomous glycyl radical cofactor GrcA
MSFFTSFNRVLAALKKYNVDYILIGGYAVALHGVPRATNDIDLLIKPEEDNFVKLRKALYEVFNDDAVNDIILIDKEDYNVTRYGTPQGYAIDILVKIGELYNYYNIKFHEIEIEKIKVNIADIDSLIKLKENTSRNIDQEDVYNLKLLKKDDAGI